MHGMALFDTDRPPSGTSPALAGGHWTHLLRLAVADRSARVAGAPSRVTAAAGAGHGLGHDRAEVVTGPCTVEQRPARWRAVLRRGSTSTVGSSSPGVQRGSMPLVSRLDSSPERRLTHS